MTDIILDYELTIRLIAFFSIFAVMAGWEAVQPCRQQRFTRSQRWFANLGITLLNTLLLRLLFPTAAVGFAAFAEAKGWGLLNEIQLPFWLSVIIAVTLMDMVIYLQHVMVHAVPALWRLHRVHHADPDYDLTTGARFHPIEILLSMLIKIATIAALGPPVIAVLIFEVILNGMAMFNHGNVSLPKPLDRLMRWLVVTPDMHRVHHSVIPGETNSNFGFNLSIWDRLMGTYRAAPKLGHIGMQIGVNSLQDPQLTTKLNGLLKIPFLKNTQGGDDYNVQDRTWPGQGDNL
ncbi:MAG: sterol desaturase family protein [Candidatus Thiodiazotropha lotti]|uniref:Fatty acid hydroxylase n=1 Tax=Candidatus Thiodiazotropha endoloripes TaxID=1818881 RepID=A0A1E2UIQ9_9GAMM|nr:sterol desaturase family protein [Candidatus Thiodiazotropha endoloripes]MCG7898590.1 sterol desaturase family protein [Candidatus Thiodiazotropha weberae]MCG7992821.1 sterol desaturase family protein [Candidatus Thiodiazotropha lotti]MCG7901730.1 sterol desaturase family protein [Candidatus Thiodiazotropha weberae]MCG7998886.1 sterol desaturase family protein [Candidatus Thiodiazotropha lotti]MCW4184482.1 sterol desaturase family protein [Candidatus Thiodiazotropha weberae]